MPRVNAILETVLYVADLASSAGFYARVMGLSCLHADARMRAFDVNGRGVLLLFLRGATRVPVKTPGGIIPPHDGAGPQHLAFAVDAEALPDWRAHLQACEVALESETTWPRGGTSLYFRDPCGHLLELASPGLWKGY